MNAYADKTNLQPFYENVTKDIRSVAAAKDFAIFYEPT